MGPGGSHTPARPERKRRHTVCHGGIGGMVLQLAHFRQNVAADPLSPVDDVDTGSLRAVASHHADRREAGGGRHGGAACRRTAGPCQKGAAGTDRIAQFSDHARVRGSVAATGAERSGRS